MSQANHVGITFAPRRPPMDTMQELGTHEPMGQRMAPRTATDASRSRTLERREAIRGTAGHSSEWALRPDGATEKWTIGEIGATLAAPQNVEDVTGKRPLPANPRIRDQTVYLAAWRGIARDADK